MDKPENVARSPEKDELGFGGTESENTAHGGGGEKDGSKPVCESDGAPGLTSGGGSAAQDGARVAPSEEDGRKAGTENLVFENIGFFDKHRRATDNYQSEIKHEVTAERGGTPSPAGIRPATATAATAAAATSSRSGETGAVPPAVS